MKRTLGRPPEHVYLGVPTSVASLAVLAGVGRTTMVRRLLILTPEEAVELGPMPNLAARRAATEVVPRRVYFLGGQRRSAAALARLAGCSRVAMIWRLDNGSSPEEAVADGPDIRRAYHWQGKPISIPALAAMAGCTASAMGLRLRRSGRTPEQAVAMGPRASRWSPAAKLAPAAGESPTARPPRRG